MSKGQSTIADPPGEQWRDIGGFEGAYQVSSYGRVKSLPRKRVPTERLLRPQLKSGEYLGVILCRGIRGHQDHRLIHQLVAIEFLRDSRFPGAQVCHNDGDKSNNRASNLRWGTASSNQLDRIHHGSHHHANKTHCVHGHEFTAENTYLSQHSNGRWHRKCRRCIRNRTASRRKVAQS